MCNAGSRKVVALLAARSLKAARLRNIMAVCAIALTSVLFTTLPYWKNKCEYLPDDKHPGRVRICS